MLEKKTTTEIMNQKAKSFVELNEYLSKVWVSQESLNSYIEIMEKMLIVIMSLTPKEADGQKVIDEWKLKVKELKGEKK